MMKVLSATVRDSVCGEEAALVTSDNLNLRENIYIHVYRPIAGLWHGPKLREDGPGIRPPQYFEK